MGRKSVDVILHINENLDLSARESLRDELMRIDGVMAAEADTAKQHLMIIEYNPDVTDPASFVELAKQRGLHTQLIGM